MSHRYAALLIEGVDAMPFLQSQLATDLRPVADGEWRWAAVCSLKGRVIATGPLLRAEQQRWLWLVAADLADSLASHLRRYVLRSKLSLRRVPHLTMAATRSLGDLGAGRKAAVVGQQEPLTWSAAELPAGWNLRIDISAQEPGDHPGPAETSQSSDNLRDWAQARLRQGMAIVSQRSSEQHLSQALELPKLQAVSLNKGCYPGQEIIARTHYLGRNKRALVLIKASTTELKPGQRLTWRDTEVGEVVESAGDLALAAIEERADDGAPLMIEGMTVALEGALFATNVHGNQTDLH